MVVSQANINLHDATLWVFLMNCKEAIHDVYHIFLFFSNLRAAKYRVHINDFRYNL